MDLRKRGTPRAKASGRRTRNKKARSQDRGNCVHPNHGLGLSSPALSNVRFAPIADIRQRPLDRLGLVNFHRWFLRRGRFVAHGNQRGSSDWAGRPHGCSLCAKKGPLDRVQTRLKESGTKPLASRFRDALIAANAILGRLPPQGQAYFVQGAYPKWPRSWSSKTTFSYVKPPN